MSFILDKLRESGKKRQIELLISERQKKLPGTDIPQPAVKQEPEAPLTEKHNKRSFLFYLILLVLLINVVVIIWILRPGESEKKVASSELRGGSQEKSTNPGTEKIITGINNPSENFPPLHTKMERASSSHMNGSTLSGAEKNSDEPQIPEVDPELKKKHRIQTPEIMKHVSGEDNKSSGSGKSHSALPRDTENYSAVKNPLAIKQTVTTDDRPVDHARTGSVPDLRELPLSVQETIPSVKISSHLYSPGQTSRLASINGRIMQEGHTMDNGMYLEEITADGVIMRYHDHRFHIKAY